VLIRTVCLLIFLLAASFAQAGETPIPPAPARWVTDTAGFLSADAAGALDAQLEAYERSSGHQVVVYIGATTGGVPIEDWAVRAFEAWKVGRKGMDDGLALFIMAEDRRLRMEVGYGLEAQLPDATASRIINEIIVPRIQAGDRDGAVAAGVAAVVGVLGGAGLPGPGDAAPPDEGIGTGQLVIGGTAALLFLILLVTNPSLAIQLLIIVASSGRHGGRGGFGGGGFGGRGGRSGGGGASGSW
jgi:uncharacterized protein